MKQMVGACPINAMITAPQNALRIIQISDCHLSANPADLYRGQSADDNLNAVVRSARGWKPQWVMVTGDVSEDGSEDSYARASAMLHSFDVPLLALPGNHDDGARMRRYFPQGPWDKPYVASWGNWQLILLDSTRSGEVSGFFSANELEQVQGALRSTEAGHTLVALHHQPIAVKAPWIDRYGLQDPQRLFALLDQHESVRCITWGHIHHDFGACRNGVSLLGTPSSSVNSLPQTSRFSPDPAGPACRWLKLLTDGSVESGILSVGQGTDDQ
jgi:Icc protein